MKTIINLSNVIKGNISSSSMSLLHMSLYYNPPYIIAKWLNIQAITCQKQGCSSFQANNIHTDKSNVVGKEKTKVGTKSIKERPLSEEQKRKRKEFFLKEEEWEKNLDLNRLSQRGNTTT